MDSDLEEWLLRWVERSEFVPHPSIGTVLVKHAVAGQLPTAVLATVRRSERGAYLKEIRAAMPDPALNPGEPWADRILSDLDTMDADESARWRALIDHAGTATAAKPAERWTQRAARLLQPLPNTERIADWLDLVGGPRSILLQSSVNEAFDSHNATFLRGLIWTLGLLPASARNARVLARAVDTSLRKIPGIGPRAVKIANAAVVTLSALANEDALAQLARLSTRVSVKATAKLIDAGLDAQATALGMSRADLEEIVVPEYGLTEVGRRVEELGGSSAELIMTARTATLTWRNSAGKTVKSPPVEVKRDHGEVLAELKASVKDIEKMLVAQRDRIDGMMSAARTWKYANWRERYLDQVVVGVQARALIWVVDDVACAWNGVELVDVDGRPISAENELVRLWHPIGEDVTTVLRWREWLAEHQITQPFKQAHREVYLITEAERATGTYSNRYAAHILRQHQYHALAAVRGWDDSLRMMVDDVYPPTVRKLAHCGLRAEFWVEGAGEEWGTDTNESGAYLYLATDQVRFYRMNSDQGTGEALPLAEIPSLVFSEVMRDIDLFVGVTSVGNDPTWSDGGPAGRYRDYWHSYSFGELSGTALTRRDTLRALVPRLAIGDRCTVDDRFLTVRGELRTYRIHLGSGNILMEPNNEYLCIVPARAASVPASVFLPFDGDARLAVILSKAILLAADSSISDRTILSQIRRS